MTTFFRSILVLLCASPLTGAEKKTPNILFLLSDDQGWGDYGFMGHPHIETPALDKLAANGLTFTRGYTPVPLCRPSLASIVTGKQPHQHGITGNSPFIPKPDSEKPNPPAEEGEAEVEEKPQIHLDLATINQAITQEWQTQPNWIRSLNAAGYRSFQTGKWWEGSATEGGGFTQGMTTGKKEDGGRHGDKGLSIGRKTLQPIKDFISEESEQPWFVWYGVFLPHTPHNPPKELLDKYLAKTDNPNIAAYWACCEWLDQTIGELMTFLEESGQLENTIIVYTCDNGWIQDPNFKRRFAPRSKRTAYEGGIRTPIIFSWKDEILPRKDTYNLASNLDIWPTTAALCGLSQPKDLSGINLTNFAAVDSREAIYGASYLHDIIEHGKPLRSLQHRFTIHQNWKLLLPNPLVRGVEARPELYDLARDPNETDNLAEDFPDKVKSLATKVNHWWTPRP